MTTQINDAGLALIKEFEGFRDTAYQDQAGIWSIGYGHTIGVSGGETCTEAEATEWLSEDLATAEQTVDSLVNVPLSGNQFAALVSFTYNVGSGNFGKSTLLQLLNRGWYEQIPVQLSRWNRVNGAPDAGLTRRRAAEAALWETAS